MLVAWYHGNPGNTKKGWMPSSISLLTADTTWPAASSGPITSHHSRLYQLNVRSSQPSFIKLLFSSGFCCCGKMQLGDRRGDGWFGLHCCVTADQGGKQAGAQWSRNHEPMMLPGLLFASTQLASFYNPRLPTQGWHFFLPALPPCRFLICEDLRKQPPISLEESSLETASVDSLIWYFRTLKNKCLLL